MPSLMNKLISSAKLKLSQAKRIPKKVLLETKQRITAQRLRKHFFSSYIYDRKERLAAQPFLKETKAIIVPGKKSFLVDLIPSEFESRIALSVLSNSRNRFNYSTPIFNARISFSKGTVIIVALQGTKNSTAQIKEFEKMVGKPIANFLVEEIERTASKAGYNEVRISRPEFLGYFQAPFISDFSFPKRGRDLIDKQALEGLSMSEKEELSEIKMDLKDKIRRRMMKLYYGVFRMMGYEPHRLYYFKKLK